jgi:diacylglycerol kinase (ATP)
VRVAAILHPKTKEAAVRPFEAAGVNIFRGNAIEPPDYPDVAMVFGGDGSVHRVIQPLAKSETPLLCVPTGSGNDFAHALGIRSVADAIRAWKQYLAGANNVRSIDLGVILPLTPLDKHPDEFEDWQKDTKPINERSQMLGGQIMKAHLRHTWEDSRLEIYFGCIAGAGLDAEANRRANAMPGWFRANGGYIISAFKALKDFSPQQMRVSLLDGQGDFRTHISEPALVVAFGNAPAYGNGMKMTARAKLDDGLLDICFVRSIPKLKVLRLFHTLFSGAHVSLREVEYLTTNHFRLETERPMEIYADGEHVCDTPVEVRVEPLSLRVIIPA